MRHFLLTLLLLSVVGTCVRAQVGAAVDAEYVEWCMVDSLAGGQVERFTRIYHVPTRETIDVGADGALYTVAGTTLTCEAYELLRTLDDPLDDFYENCQCEYTISQEGHRVIEIRGGAQQDYTIEFQEVVRRRCSSEGVGVVLHRETLTRTDPFRTTNRIEYDLPFVNIGDFVDDISLARYSPGSSTRQIIQVDFNPSTVQATYPGLTLDPADFEYDGSNLSDIVAAYQEVLDAVFSNATNEITVSESAGLISISFQYMHQPPGVYIMLLGEDDLLYSITGPVATNPTLQIIRYAHGVPTSTNVYTEYCESINTVESAFYFDFNVYDPLVIQPNIGVETSLVTNLSNPVASCDVPPQVCAAVVPNEVVLTNDCVKICSDVLNVAGQFKVMAADTTIAARTYNSFSLLVTTGTVGVTIDGNRMDYQAGRTVNWRAQEGKLLENIFLIDASGGEADILFVR